MLKQVLKIILLIFLIVLGGFQVGFLLKYYFATPDTTAVVSTTATQNSNIVLTSSTSEDPGVAVSSVRAAVVYITGKGTATTAAPPSNALISFAPTSRDKMGSGIIFDSRGYILTNYHVVSQIVDVQASLFGGQNKTYPCEIISIHPEIDLAIIKITTGYPLPTAILGNSDMVEVTDEVMAVGCPFNLEQSVTHGIISDTKRTVEIDGRQYNDLLQTDAVINSGNSGGALVNMKGHVIGVNVAIYAPSRVYCGVGFAIPINRAKIILMKVKYLIGEGV